MLKIDKVQLEIIINGDPARLQLNQLSKESSDLKKEYKGAKTELEKGVALDKLKAVEKQMEDVRHEIGLAGMSMKELTQRSSQLKAILNQLKPNTAEFKAYQKELTEVNARQKELKGHAEKTGGIFSSVGAKIAVATTAVVGVVSAFGGLISNIISVRSQFEKYEAILKNTLGSQQKASETMDMISVTAAKTNFSLMELTEVYVKLANRNLKPNQDDLMRLADMANSTGKDMGQLSEAILDINNQERWKEFGVKVTTAGDKVTLSFKGVSQTVAKTEEAVMNAMIAFGKMPGVFGQTEAISATLQGRISNLGDSWDRMLNAMGEGGFSGIVKEVISGIGGIVDGFTNMIKASPVETLQKEQTELNTLVGAITSTNTNQKLRNELIGELQTKYPDFLKNLNIEKLTNEQLQKRLSEVNEEYLKRIRIAVVQEDITKNEQAMTDVMKEQKDINKQIAADYNSYVKNKKENATLEEKIAAIAKTYQTISTGTGGQTSTKSNEGRASEFTRLANKYKSEQIALEKEYQDLLQDRAKMKGNDDVQQAEAEAAEKATKQKIEAAKKASEAAAKQHVKDLEEQKKYLSEVLTLGMNATEKENNEYNERLKKAGLFYIKDKKLTTDQLKGIEILENQHKTNLEKINEDIANKKKADQDKFNKEILQTNKDTNAQILTELESCYNAELDAAGNNAGLRKTIDEKYAADKADIELGSLQTTKGLLILLKESTVDIEQQIADKTNQIRDSKFAKSQEKDAVRKEYNLVNMAEQEQIELDALQAKHDQGLLTEEEFEKAKFNIKLNNVAKYAEKAGELINAFGNIVTGLQETEITNNKTKYDRELADLEQKHNNGLISDDAYNKKKTAIEKKQQEEEKNIKKKYADKQFAIQVAQIIASTAQAAINAYQSMSVIPVVGPVLGGIAAAAAVVYGGVQIANAKAQRDQVKSLAKGQYNVIGASDGQPYDNVPFTGEAKTGFYNKPTLVAERGREIVIDNPTVQRLIAHEPYVIDRILANRVPQRAEGNYPVQGGTQSNMSNEQMVIVLATLGQTVNELKNTMKNGIQARMSHERFDTDRAQWERQKADVTRT